MSHAGMLDGRSCGAAPVVRSDSGSHLAVRRATTACATSLTPVTERNGRGSSGGKGWFCAETGRYRADRGVKGRMSTLEWTDW